MSCAILRLNFLTENGRATKCLSFQQSVWKKSVFAPCEEQWGRHMLYESLNKTCELLAYSEKVSEKLSVRESSGIRGNTTHTIKCSIREVKGG